MTYSVSAKIPFRGDFAIVTNQFKKFEKAAAEFERQCKLLEIKTEPIEKGTIWAKEEKGNTIIEFEKHSL